MESTNPERVAASLKPILGGVWILRSSTGMKREIDLLLLKLADGGRILRFSDPQSDLSLEKRLDPQEPVARQKQRWKQVFVSMLDRELGPAG